MTLAPTVALLDTGEAALVAWLLVLPAGEHAEVVAQIRAELRPDDFTDEDRGEVLKWRLAQLERKPGTLEDLVKHMRARAKVALALATERLALTPTWPLDDPAHALEAARGIVRRSVHRGLVELVTARLHGLRGAPVPVLSLPARTPAVQLLEAARAAEEALLARLPARA